MSTAISYGGRRLLSSVVYQFQKSNPCCLSTWLQVLRSSLSWTRSTKDMSRRTDKDSASDSAARSARSMSSALPVSTQLDGKMRYNGVQISGTVH